MAILRGKQGLLCGDKNDFYGSIKFCDVLLCVTHQDAFNPPFARVMLTVIKFFYYVIESLRYALTHFHTITPFDAPGKHAFCKHWGKEKLLVTSNFSFSHSVFYLFG